MSVRVELHCALTADGRLAELPSRPVRKKTSCILIVSTEQGGVKELSALSQEEGGVEVVAPELTGDLIAMGVLDEIHVTWQPFIAGRAQKQTLTGADDEFLPKIERLRLKKKTVTPDGCRLVYAVRR